MRKARNHKQKSLLLRNKSNKLFNYWRMLNAYQSSRLPLLHHSKLRQQFQLKSNLVRSIFQIRSSQTALWANFRPFL